MTDAAPMRLTALTVEQAAEILNRSGARAVTTDTIRADLANGAPQNPDGTVPFVSFLAWMVNDLNRRIGHDA